MYFNAVNVGKVCSARLCSRVTGVCFLKATQKGAAGKHIKFETSFTVVETISWALWIQMIKSMS